MQHKTKMRQSMGNYLRWNFSGKFQYTYSAFVRHRIERRYGYRNCFYIAQYIIRCTFNKLLPFQLIVVHSSCVLAIFSMLRYSIHSRSLFVRCSYWHDFVLLTWQRKINAANATIMLHWLLRRQHVDDDLFVMRIINENLPFVRFINKY